MLRWGVLGPGAVAAAKLAPAMLAVGHDLAAVGSRSRTRAQAFAASHGFRRARGSYREVVEADDVDAVYLALPNDLHEPWAVAALEAGKHVLCEKPLALDAAAAQRMAAASARSGRVLMEAVMARFHPRTEAWLQTLAEGVIGPVQTIHAAFGTIMGDALNYRARPEQGGGALLDLGVYGVAASRWGAGEEPEGVTALWRRWDSGVDGATAAVLAFPGGALATIVASFDTARHDLLTIAGPRGTLEVPQAFTASDEAEAALLRDGRVVGAWRANPYERMLAHFAEVCGGAPPTLPVEDALASAVVLDRIAEAAGR
ncbi:MAG: Gfo/Idh/MocA family protein [Actinomycetota bacterium]